MQNTDGNNTEEVLFEEDYDYFRRLPKSIRDFMMYDAVASYNSIQAYGVLNPGLFQRPMSEQEVLQRLRMHSRQVHRNCYGGKRPEDGA